MNIHQLSADIDIKLVQLEQQLQVLQQKFTQKVGDTVQLENDIAALNQLKYKLKKSRDIAWRAYELQGGNNKAQQQKRMLGLGLCVFCGLGLLFIVGFVLLK